MRERDHLEDLGVDVRIILRLVLRKWNGWYGLGWTQDRTGGGLLYML